MLYFGTSGSIDQTKPRLSLRIPFWCNGTSIPIPDATKAAFPRAMGKSKGLRLSFWWRYSRSMGNLEKSVIEVEVEADSNNSALYYTKELYDKRPWPAVYLYVKDTEGSRTFQLVIAKSRVASSKRITFPRLEFLASYITARLINYTEALHGMINEILAWSDSKILELDTRKPSNNWKIFVAKLSGKNSHERVDPDRWKFCPGDQNLCSRFGYERNLCPPTIQM